MNDQNVGILLGAATLALPLPMSLRATPKRPRCSLGAHRPIDRDRAQKHNLGFTGERPTGDRCSCCLSNISNVAVRSGNLADSHALLDQGGNQLQVIKVGLRVLAPASGRLITRTKTISALPDSQSVRLQAGQARDGADAIKRPRLKCL